METPISSEQVAHWLAGIAQVGAGSDAMDVRNAFALGVAQHWLAALLNGETSPATLRATVLRDLAKGAHGDA